MSTPAYGARPHAAAELAVDAVAVADPDDPRDAVGGRPDLPLEANPADVAEQDADDVEVRGARIELPLEANPADVAEQDTAVPYDDDLYGDDER
jgi:hypothetical protein